MATLFDQNSTNNLLTGGIRPRSHCLLSKEQFETHRAQLQQIVKHRTLDPAGRQELLERIGQRILASSRCIQSPNFIAVSSTDLQNMADHYDQEFLGGHCLAIARHFGLHFRWSKRMTSNGGKTVRTVQMDRRNGTKRITYEIVLSAPLLFQTFNDLQRPIRVTGILCTNRLQAMQRILEHELIHLVELLVWDHSCCASRRFQGIAQRLFGHTEHKHDLITQRERADRQFNVQVGSRVQFWFEGKMHIGTVNRITQRATILVADPLGQLYDDGQRYRKFYVPLAHLDRAPL